MRGLEQETKMQLEDLYQRLDKAKEREAHRKELYDGKLADLAAERRNLEEQIKQLELRQMNFGRGED